MKDPQEYAGWLIKKQDHYYRPNWAGYTKWTLDAGRYTMAQAKAEQAMEPDNFTIEPAPEMLPNGVGKFFMSLFQGEYTWLHAPTIRENTSP